MAKTETDHGRPGDEPKSGGMNVRVVLNAVRRHPLALALVIVLAGAAGAGVWYFLPLPKTTAAVVFRVSPQYLDGGGGGDFATYKQSQAALLKSRSILIAALGQPGVKDLAIVQSQPDPLQQIQWLDRALKVDFRTGPEFMRVTIEGENADELQILLGGLSTAYLEVLRGQENKQRREGIAHYQKLLAACEAEITKLHRDDDYEAGGGLGATEPRLLALLYMVAQEELRVLYPQLPSLRRDKERADRDLAAATWAPDSAVASVAGATWASLPPWTVVNRSVVDEILRGDPEVQRLEAAVKEADKNLKVILSSFTDLNTQVARTTIPPYREALKEAEKQRETYLNAARPPIEKDLRQKSTRAYESNLAKFQSAAADHAQRFDAAEAKIKDLEHKLKSTRDFNGKFAKNNADRERFEKERAEHLGRISRLNIEMNVPSRVGVIEEPFIVAGLEGNKRMKYALGATVGAFLAGFAGLVWWEHRGRRVTHANDIPTEVGTAG